MQDHPELELNEAGSERLVGLTEVNQEYANSAVELRNSARENLPPGVKDSLGRIGKGALFGTLGAGVDVVEGVLTFGVPEPLTEFFTDEGTAFLADKLGYKVDNISKWTARGLNLLPGASEFANPLSIQGARDVFGGMKDLGRAIGRNLTAGPDQMAIAA